MITIRTVGTSLGIYYLIYRDSTFIESCDESELSDVMRRLDIK